MPLSKRKDFEQTPELRDLDGHLRTFLELHPPTLGHGYSHLKKVARLSHAFAAAEGLARLEVAYVAGLLHDLYRPARGEAGEEPHEVITARHTRALLGESAFAADADFIADLILEHDRRILAGHGTGLMRALSLADKADMSLQRVAAYAWASNCYRASRDAPPRYRSFQEIQVDFDKYRQRAAAVLRCTSAAGRAAAHAAYAETSEQLAAAVVEESAGRLRFEKRLAALVAREAAVERRFWEAASRQACHASSF